MRNFYYFPFNLEVAERSTLERGPFGRGSGVTLTGRLGPKYPIFGFALVGIVTISLHLAIIHRHHGLRPRRYIFHIPLGQRPKDQGNGPVFESLVRERYAFWRCEDMLLERWEVIDYGDNCSPALLQMVGAILHSNTANLPLKETAFWDHLPTLNFLI